MRTICVVSVLAVGAGVFCAAQAAAPLGGVEVTRSTVRLDAANGGRAEVEVELMNNSGKRVVAWDCVVEGTYADGSAKRTSPGTDDISALLTPETLVMVFLPGTARSTNATLPLGKTGDLPTKVETTLTMVAFDDDTAAGDAGSIHQLGSARRHIATVMNALLDGVQEARGAPDPRGALKALIDKNPGKGMYMHLLPTFDEGPEALEKVLSMYRTYRDLLEQHSALKAVD